MYYSSGACTSYIMSETQFADVNYWLLGLNIYRAFEISHDLENNQIGFSALGTSTVTSAEEDGA